VVGRGLPILEAGVRADAVSPCQRCVGFRLKYLACFLQPRESSSSCTTGQSPTPARQAFNRATASSGAGSDDACAREGDGSGGARDRRNAISMAAASIDPRVDRSPFTAAT